MIRRHLGFGLNVAALGLFFPGILLPMFSLNMEMAGSLSGSSIVSTIVDKELSIIATVQELLDDQRVLVAALIFLFSVCIPVVKTCLVSVAYFKPGTAIERQLFSLISNIGKWSMADVYVVAIFLDILSTNHAETAVNHGFSVFGFKLSLDISTQTLSAAGEGFYYFTGYCILSLLGIHLAQTAVKGRNISLETNIR